MKVPAFLFRGTTRMAGDSRTGLAYASVIAPDTDGTARTGYTLFTQPAYAELRMVGSTPVPPDDAQGNPELERGDRS